MLPCDGIMERNFGDAVSDYFFVPGTYTIFGYDEGIRGRVVNSPPSMLAELQELFAIPLRPSVVQRSNSLIVTEDGFMHHIGARIIDDKIHVRLYGA
ncbi:MAG: hypothetical protein LBG64_02465 [Pseudomonadales bacterium]|nr:hypothetical protein [Pseudomonadales bacterium]